MSTEHLRGLHGGAHVATYVSHGAHGVHGGLGGRSNFAAGSPPSSLLHQPHHAHHIKQENSINALYDNFMTPPTLTVKLA